MFIRTVTDGPPTMDGNYPFKGLIMETHVLCLPKDAGVSTKKTPTLDKIVAVLAADDTTLITNSREQMMRVVKALYSWKHRSRYETNDSKFHSILHGAKRTNLASGLMGCTT